MWLLLSMTQRIRAILLKLLLQFLCGILWRALGFGLRISSAIMQLYRTVYDLISHDRAQVYVHVTSTSCPLWY